MPIENFLDAQPVETICHDGDGLIKIANLFNDDFRTALQFVHYTVLPARTSIGMHKHGDDEEIYFILEGCGVIDAGGVRSPVKKGDVILNRPFGTHALYNTSDSEELKMLVVEVANPDVSGIMSVRHIPLY